MKNYATALAFVLLLAHFALAQDSQFLFDANGNLALQMAETSGQPQILRQPQNQVVAPGEAASFSVVVADSRGLTPQWLFNGTNINGAMSDTLLLTNVNALEEGQYSVVLSNSSGSVTSAPALLMLDSDGDGLPDSWELAYFGNLNQTATGDFDGDGISNLNEFLDGTNPTNSASVLLRLTLFTDGGQVTVNPNRFTFTNGETVTLTATPFAPDSFHLWTGDSLSRSNPLTVIMTSNKTISARFKPLDFMWTGPSGGDWNTNSNWNFNITPGTNDLAYITNAAATVTINSAAECGSLIFGDSANAPTLTGNGTLTLRGASVWTAGTMGGTGRTVVEAAGSLLINNSGNCFLSGRTLENGGTIVWTGAGIIGFISAVITNRPGALFDVQNASTFFYSGGNVSRFDNAGTFRKSVGAGTSTFANNVNFNNYSAVEIQSGTLLFGGGLVNIGTVALSPGTTNRISGAGSANGSFTNPATSLVEWPGNTYTLNSGAQLNGSGLYRVTGSGVLVCNTDASVENLNLDDLLDGSGRVTINHTMNWTGGSMFGSGRTIIAPTATLNIANASAVTLSSRTLENGGTVFWTGGGGISLASTVITNRTGALFSAQNSATISFQGGAICRFDNAGTFRKSVGAGTCTFANNVNFNNYSAIELQTGTLLFGGSLLNNGTVTLSDGTTNRISGGGSANGSFTNPATSLVEWPGSTYTLNSGAQLNGSGLYRVTGSGGVTCNADVSVDNLNVEYLFDGSGRVTINNTMNWTASSMSGSGRTIIAPGATLNIANPSVVDLSSRTLENGGTVFWTGAGGISLTGTVITNRAGALFHCQNAASITYRGGNVSRFDNAGTFRKSSAGTSMIGFNVGFNNYNAVDIRSGIVVVDGNYTSSAGAVLNCSLGGAAVGTGYAQLKSGGTIGLNGALNVYFTNGFYPTTNTTFTVVSAGTRSGTFGSFSYPSNIVIMQLSNSATSVVLRVNDLTTNGPPQITSDFPTNQVFYAGRVITLSPTVAGVKPFTYQWKKNGTDLSDDGRIAGAQSNVLAITNISLADSGNYQVFVTNAQGFARSLTDAVVVQAVPKFNAAGAGWSLQGTTPPVMNASNVTLTSGLGNTARAVFYNAPLYIASFSASFLYRDVGGGGADGITFCLHNDPRGAATLGGSGGGLGYSGIAPSAALAMNIYSPNVPGISWRTNGTLPPAGSYNPTTPVNIASGNPIFVTLLYTGGVLRATFVESNTANVFTTNLLVNIPAIVGAETAYVGFTGADGGIASTQVVSNFVFVPITGVAAQQFSPDTLTLSWPASIGGYSVQTKSDLTAGADVWQSVTNLINQVSGKNQVIISPLIGNRYYKLSINIPD